MPNSNISSVQRNTGDEEQESSSDRDNANKGGCGNSLMNVKVARE